MKVPLSRPVISGEMIKAVNDVFSNERLVGGRSVKLFEDDFSEYIGTNNAIAVSSGTSALFLILKAMNIKKGDIVLTTSATFIATANAISHCGATPVFVDINKQDNNMAIQELEKVLDKHKTKVKAVLPVHLYGRPVDIEGILKIASEYDVPVVEDACQAHGASYGPKRAGNLGYAAAFSFYTSKNITVGGDGGMITTNDHELAKKIRQLRNQGSSEENRYLHEYIGYNMRLNTINAAFGRVQLKYIDQWIKNRREISKRYNSRLKKVREIRPPLEDDYKVKSAWHLFVIKTKERDKLSRYLKNNLIETGIHYPIPVHLQSPYFAGFKSSRRSLRNTEEWSQEILSLPIFNEMSREENDYVIEKIIQYYK